MRRNADNFLKIVHTIRPTGANLWTKFQSFDGLSIPPCQIWSLSVQRPISGPLPSLYGISFHCHLADRTNVVFTYTV